MALFFTNAVNTSRATALVTAAGSGSTIKIYSGAAPVNADTAATGTLLVTLTIAGVLGAVSAGVITLGAVTSGTAVATGTAGYAVVATSAAVTVAFLTSIATSGADLNLNSTSISSGGTVSVTSGTITEVYP